MTEPEAWRAAYEAGFPNRLPPDHKDYNPEVQRYHEHGFRAGFLTRTASPPISATGGTDLVTEAQAWLGAPTYDAGVELVIGADLVRRLIAALQPGGASAAPITEDAADLIQACADQFRDYERQHRAKGTPEADAKAEVSAAFARRCTAMLGARSARASAAPESLREAVAVAVQNGFLKRQTWGEIADAILALPELAAPEGWSDEQISRMVWAACFVPVEANHTMTGVEGKVLGTDDARAIIRAALAAAAAPLPPAAPGGWRAIEGAALRRGSFIVWCPDESPYGGYQKGEATLYENGEWRMHGVNGSRKVHPTHYQPLPPAPADERGEPC